jgi:glutamate N-acetyltransferase/amino-acid N-acetyltransferase
MQRPTIEPVAAGTVTSPRGFHAGAAQAGIKDYGHTKPDLGILFSEARCVAAAVFTRNKIKSAPVLLDQTRLKKGTAVAVVANSGCANASTGEQGMKDAEEMAALAAGAIGAEPEDVLVASTGVIGKLLPMQKIRDSVRRIALSPEGGHDFARAIMTTDTLPKEVAVAVRSGETSYTIGGVVKGSGMIHPNMGTMLCFLSTDARVEPAFLQSALNRAVDGSFNMISVDGDTSPSDTVVIMANGLANNEAISAATPQARVFRDALARVCVHLARAVARDGEGATRLIEVTVTGGRSARDARLAARTVISSSLVKSAVHGADPNWGRILAAVGRSGADVSEALIDLQIGDITVLKGGQPQVYDEASVSDVFKRPEVAISVKLNLGKAAATAWGCDLSEEYVKINSEYMT